MIDVSIIIPVYNRQELGVRALRSVLVQGTPQAEIIFVDDCSRPAFEVPAALVAENIRIIRHPINRGAAAARNTAVENAKGEWLAFLNSDDVWINDTFQPRLEMAKQACATEPSALVAYAAGFVLQNNLTGRNEKRIPRASARASDFVSGCWFSPGSTLVVHRDVFHAVGSYDTALSRLEDLDWFLRLALAGGQLERWPQIAALIELGDKPRIATLEQAATHLMAKYADSSSPMCLPPELVCRLKAYLDLERASIYSANRRWFHTLFYLGKSLMRVPRLTLHLERFWEN